MVLSGFGLKKSIDFDHEFGLKSGMFSFWFGIGYFDYKELFFFA